MTPLQCLLCRMLGFLIIIAVLASKDDPELADSSLINKTNEMTIDKPNGVDNENTIYQDCADACSVTDWQIECIDCIPRDVLSEGVNEIVLSRLNENRIVPHMFCGVSWPHIIDLTILNAEGDFFYIKNFTFNCLPKIDFLKLGLQYLKNFSHNAFYGLDNVEILDLTDCIRLEIPGLTPGLSSHANVPGLRTLILSNVGSAYDGIVLSQDFMDIFAHRNIHTLDMSSSTIRFANQHVNIDGLCKSVEVLKLKNSILDNMKLDLPPACDSLRLLDVSRTTFPWASKLKGNITIKPGVYPLFDYMLWINLFRRVLLIYANNIIPTTHNIYMNNVTVYLRMNNSLTEIYLSGYSLPVLEATFKIDPNQLEIFDISNNKIERLGPELLTYFKQLRIVDLSNNKLAVSKQFEDTFSKLFRNNSKLESVKLSNNGLTNCPLNMFELNTEINEIDMSNNKLTQILFRISHLHKLYVLDLKRNSIEYLNIWSRHQIDMMYKNKEEKQNTTDDKSFTVDLRDNIFSCKCQSLDFIKWFMHSPVFEKYRDSYYCEKDGKHIQMDKGAINTAQYDCDKPKRETRLLLIILLPCGSTAILVVLVIVLFKQYKRQKRLRWLRKQIDLIHENQFGYRFPVFLSYASEDSEFVEPNILQPLEVSSFYTISHLISFCIFVESETSRSFE